MQPELAALLRELGLATFPQNNDGDVIFERMSRETPSRYRVTQQEQQSMRFAGGTGVLIKALVKQIPADGVLINTSVKQIVLATKKITLTITQADGSEDMVVVDQVIAAIPPRLLAKISFEPAVDPATARRWRETATWMAPHAKFFAVYDRPFWRYAGLSGTALRFALNRTVVLRFRLHLESLGLAAGTVNQRLAAVRRLAYEAADSGLLSPELVTGIRRVKGAKQLDARQGKWLTQDQVRLLLEKADGDDLRSVRDVAMFSVLVGCGLRRAELSA